MWKDVLKITYVNELPIKCTEACAVNPCMDMTNVIGPHLGRLRQRNGLRKTQR